MKGDSRGVSAPRGASSALQGRDRKRDTALRAALEARRDEIIEKWLAHTVANYPEFTSRFFRHEKDRFRNPVGHALKEGLPLLVEYVIGDADESRIDEALESIVKIRAVQDLTAAQAVAFIFHLKQILRDVNPELIVKYSEGLVWIECRIDQMALLAFDHYVQCREKMQELKVNAMRRRMYLMERMHTGSDCMHSDEDPENRVL